MNFKDKVALITGATGGIGHAIIRGFAERGAFVCGIGRDKDGLKKIQKEIKNSKVFCVELTEDKQIIDLKARIIEEFKGIDFLVHSAGIVYFGDLKDSSVDLLDLQFRVNVRAPYLLTQLFLPSLAERKGCVVFINSSAGLNSKRGFSQYSATKHALRSIADSLRDEVNHLKIRVLSLFLGKTATKVQKEIALKVGKRYEEEKLLDPQDVAQVLLESLTLSDRAEVTEVRMRPFLKSW